MKKYKPHRKQRVLKPHARSHRRTVKRYNAAYRKAWRQVCWEWRLEAGRDDKVKLSPEGFLDQAVQRAVPGVLTAPDHEITRHLR